MITQNILLMYIVAPFVGLFVYLVLKFLSEFKW